MRDSRKKLAKQSRRRRRAALVIILLATSPALADGLQGNSVRILPPLPLESTADAQPAKSNPFCEPIVKAGSLIVRLASGNDTSSIRLKPIGAAIGLQPINAADPNQVPSPALTIEPVPPSSIQTNPMIGSTHHANPQLIDAEIDDRASLVRPTRTFSSHEASADPNRRKSSIVLMRAAPMTSPAVAHSALPSQPKMGTEPAILSPAFQNVAIPSPTLQNATIPSPAIQNAAIPNPRIALLRHRFQQCIANQLSPRNRLCCSSRLHTRHCRCTRMQ